MTESSTRASRSTAAPLLPLSCLVRFEARLHCPRAAESDSYHQPMTRLVIDPEAEDRNSTRELRDETVAAETLRFDDAGRTQELDDEVAEAYVEEYDSLQFESEISNEELDDIGKLLAGTVDDVGTVIETGEFDSRLDEVERREQEGDARTTVLNTIERRREAINYGENGDGDGDGDSDEEDGDA